MIAQDIAALTGADYQLVRMESTSAFRAFRMRKSAEDYKALLLLELAVLEAANAAAEYPAHLRLRRRAKRCSSFTDYPAQVINWAVGARRRQPSRVDGNRLRSTVLGGLKNGKDGLLLHGQIERLFKMRPSG